MADSPRLAYSARKQWLADEESARETLWETREEHLETEARGKRTALHVKAGALTRRIDPRCEITFNGCEIACNRCEIVCYRCEIACNRCNITQRSSLS
jgi:hypothetical protein